MCKRNLVLFLLLAFSFLAVHQITAEEVYLPVSLTELSRLTTIYQDCNSNRLTALATLKQSQIKASKLQTQVNQLQALSTRQSYNLAQERLTVASLQTSLSAYKTESLSTISTQAITIADQKTEIATKESEKLKAESQRNKLFVGLIALILLNACYIFLKIKKLVPF